jgi:GAF domain-containing protein
LGAGAGDLIRHYRDREGITQKQLGDLVGRDQTSLSHIERGERSISGRDDALDIARALNLSDAETNSLLLAAGFAPLAGTARSDEDADALTFELRFKLECLTAFHEKLIEVLRRAPPRGLDPVAAECLLRAACRVFDPTGARVDRASVILPNAQRDYLHIRFATGIDERSLRERRFAMRPDENGSWRSAMGVAGLAFVTREVQLVRDVQEDPRFLPLPGRPAPYRSLLCAPLLAADECLGVVSFDAKHDGFGDLDRRLISLVAQAIALLLLQANGDVSMESSTSGRQRALASSGTAR